MYALILTLKDGGMLYEEFPTLQRAIDAAADFLLIARIQILNPEGETVLVHRSASPTQRAMPGFEIRKPGVQD